MTDQNTDALRCAQSLSLAIGQGLGDEAAAHIRRLVAENEALRADRDSWADQASDRVKDWHDEYERAKALHAELMEQARIVGMSGEREARHLAVMRQALRALSEIMQDARANHVGGWDTADRLMDAEAAIAALKERVGDE